MVPSVLIRWNHLATGLSAPHQLPPFDVHSHLSQAALHSATSPIKYAFSRKNIFVLMKSKRSDHLRCNSKKKLHCPICYPSKWPKFLTPSSTRLVSDCSSCLLLAGQLFFSEGLYEDRNPREQSVAIYPFPENI